jgi:molecular chaperone GrpE
MTQNTDDSTTEQEGSNPGAQSTATSNGEAAASSEAADNVVKMNGAEAAVDSEWKSKFTYLTAEVDNMRKRFVRERQDAIRYANEDLLKNLLPVLDNLELALKAAKDAEQKLEASLKENPLIANLVKGLEMTLKHFEKSLESSGCVALKSVGENFDPAQHEAIGQSQDMNLGDNKVSSVLQRGFTLSGRIIRTAKVFVNKITN